MLILSQTPSVSKRLHRKFSENKLNWLNCFSEKAPIRFRMFEKTKKLESFLVKGNSSASLFIGRVFLVDEQRRPDHLYTRFVYRHRGGGQDWRFSLHNQFLRKPTCLYRFVRLQRQSDLSD